MEALQELYETILESMKAKKEYKDRVMIRGEGFTASSLLLVGEAPGANEEALGAPFVGSAGKKLDAFLKTVDIPREQVYVTNLVKIRPYKASPKTGKPVNRPPNKDEISFFYPYLLEEIKIINPKYIVSLGNYPLKALAEDDIIKIGDVHGKVLDIKYGKLFPLYHPASVIYNQSLKLTFAEDLLKLKEIYHANAKTS